MHKEHMIWYSQLVMILMFPPLKKALTQNALQNYVTNKKDR